MSNLLFPTLPGISVEAKRAPQWESTVHVAASGRAVGLTCQTYPKWKYQLAIEFLRSGAQQELQAIVALFNKMRGRVDTFLFYDEDDCSVVDQQIGLGDGATTSFRLVRDLGGFIEPVHEAKVIDQIKVGGVVMASSLSAATAESLLLDFTAGSYQVWQNDYTYAGGGVVNFASPPPAGQPILWSGSYYWRCRFDDDSLNVERFLYRLWKAKSVSFTTEKV